MPEVDDLMKQGFLMFCNAETFVDLRQDASSSNVTVMSMVFSRPTHNHRDRKGGS
jgi:hypothetical protein